MAVQSNGSEATPLMVWYEESSRSKHLELSKWAKRKFMREPPLTEVVGKWAVEKLLALKKLLLRKH